MDAHCARTGKLCHTEAQAHVVLEDLKPTDPRWDLLEVYPCGDHHHVGHADVGGRRPRAGAPARPAPPPHLTHSLAAHLGAWRERDQHDHHPEAADA